MSIFVAAFPAFMISVAYFSTASRRNSWNLGLLLTMLAERGKAMTSSWASRCSRGANRLIRSRASDSVQESKRSSRISGARLRARCVTNWSHRGRLLR